jgi:hypothetical protein
MPAPQRTRASEGLPAGVVRRTIENRTAHALRVLFSGPLDIAIELPAGNVQSITLPAGTYKVVGKVSAASVLPFYGEQTYAAGDEYRSHFDIE